MGILGKKGKFAQKKERKGLWRGAVTGIAAIVVVCTTYALILPAITMETQGLSCGLAEHTHSQDCYQLICGKQEYFSHSHSDECYENGALVCTLTERTLHHHSEDCYSKPEPICGLTEGQGHTHAESCYTTERTLVCTQSECSPHTHSDGCYTEEAIPCTQEAVEGHTHGEDCYTDGERTCGKEETQGHTHSEACAQTKQVLTCTLAETQGHRHSDECYEEKQLLSCGQEAREAHTHSESCYPSDFQPTLICGQEDIPEHRHSQDCYARTCELEEHKHSELCVDNHEAFLENQNEILKNDNEQTGSNENFSNEEAQNQGNSQEQASNEQTQNQENSQEQASNNEEQNQQNSQEQTSNEQTQNQENSQEQASNEQSQNQQNSQEQASGNEAQNQGNSQQQASNNEAQNQQNSQQQASNNEAQNQENSGNELLGDNSAEDVDSTDGNTNNVDWNDVETAIEAGYYPICDNYEEEHVHTQECYVPIDEVEGLLGGSLYTSGKNGEEGNNGEGSGITPQTVNTIPVTSITGAGTTYDPTTGYFNSELNIDFEFPRSSVNSDTVYTFTYPNGVIIPAGLLNTDKELHDKAGNIAGTLKFIKNENGIYAVQIQLDASYLANKTDDVVGYVKFKGQLNAQRNENGNLVLAGEDTNTLTIPADEIAFPSNTTESYDVSVEKAGSYQMQNNQLSYTVYVRTTKGTNGNIQFTDTLAAAGLTLGNPNVTVQKGVTSQYDSWSSDGPGEAITITPIFGQDTEGNPTISMTLDQLNRSGPVGDETCLYKTDYYKITYTYPISEYNQELTHPNNTALVSFKDQFGNTVSDSKTSSFDINRAYSLSKSGNYQSNNGNGQINWTIFVNTNGVDISGSVLTDEMFAGLTGTDIPPQEGFTILTGDDGKVTGIRFDPIGETGVNTKQYTITYSTPVTEEWEKKLVENTATFDPTPSTPGDELTTQPVNVEVPGGSVAKSMDGATESTDGQTADVTWTVTLTVPKGGISKDFTIVDDPTKQQYYGDNLYGQWFTRSQVLAWNCQLNWLKSDNTVDSSLTISPEKVTFTASDGNTYTYSQIASDGFNTALTFTQLTIAFDNDVLPPDGCSKLTFTYHTTVDLSKTSIGRTSYGNQVSVGSQKAWAEYPHYKAGVQKTDGNGSTSESSPKSDGDVVWKVVATMDSNNHTKLTLVDNLPIDKVTLKSLKLTNDKGLSLDLSIDSGQITGSDSNQAITVSGTYDASQGIITLDVTPQSGVLPPTAVFTLVVTCTVNNAQSQTETVVLRNTATMKLDDTIHFPDVSQTQNWTYSSQTQATKVVDKTGTWDNDHRLLKYSILLNPNGDTLANSASTLSLTDELTYWEAPTDNNGTKYHIVLSLLQNTVKLYSAVRQENGDWVKGTEITNWKWTATGPVANLNIGYDGDYQMICTINADGIPNSTPLILEYNYRISSDAPDEATFSLRDINNLAKLAGDLYRDSNSHNSDNWSEQDFDAGVSGANSFTLYKVETGNYSNALNGAEFSVYAYDTTSSAYGTTAVKTYTTSDGQFEIQWEDGGCYSYNTLYKLKETTPPAGYQLPEAAEEFYFYFSNTTDTTHALPADRPATAVDLSQTGKTVYAENAKIPTTEITVNKQWFNSAGTDITADKTGSIQFDLSRLASETPPSGGSSGNGEVTFGGEIKLGNQWGSPWQTIFEDSKPAGTKVSFEISYLYADRDNFQPALTMNGAELKPSSSSVSEWEDDTRYKHTKKTYHYEIELKENTEIGGYVTTWMSSEWAFSSPTYTETSNSNGGNTPTGGTKYNEQPYIITSDASWTTTIYNLPVSYKDESGKTWYYAYYVVETTTGYSVSYENNGGIGSGTIVIKNTETDTPPAPSYFLPNTGGMGTEIYTAAGLAVSIGAVLGLMKKRKKGERE